MHACVHFEALDTELLLIDQKKVEMGFCSCFGRKKGVRLSKDEDKNWEASRTSSVEGGTMLEQRSQSSVSKDYSHAENFAPTFSYRELAAATNGFREESLIGEGGFGPVYKGTLERTGQLVAIKKLDPSGIQGTKEFLVEVLMLSLLRHPNLVNLIGYCAEGEQRLLVYEFLPLGSLEYHLHDRLPDMQPLDWDTRIMIAAGVAKGLDYLHNKADPPVIHRDLKSSNILLGEGFHPKLSDFGLAKFGPSEDKSHVSTRVMGTHGYCAPEYYGTGKLTTKSDVYCYGIVLLELITGRKAMDNTRARGQHSLLEWVRPLLRDRKNLMQIADPQIRGQFSEAALRHALELALICLQDKAQSRPSMKDVVLAINFLESLVPVAAHSTRDGRGRVSSEEGRNENTTGSQGAENTSQQARKLNKDEERKLAVAEAKLWGETWREKMLASMHKVESELHESHAS